MMEQESIDLSGRTSLRDLACLYQKALLLITTDSGPMHLGAAVNTEAIAIFGPTSPARTGPYGKGHTIVRAGLECSPCFKKKCESIKCMKAITAANVFDQVRLRLKKRR
jgi:ADP-heptose:LPS heptosyltransferase